MNEQDILDIEHATRVIWLLRAKVDAYNVAADKFILKVERGEAQSHITYSDLCAARKLPENIS